MTGGARSENLDETVDVAGLAAGADQPPTTPPGWYADPEQPATRRYWDGMAWTNQRAPLDSPTQASSFSIEFGIACLGAAIAIVGTFLPRVESDTFLRVAENTLVQSGDGLIVIALAVGAFAAAYATRHEPRRNWWVVVLGIIIIGLAIYSGTGERLDLTSASPLFDDRTVRATAGVGIWAVGVGGALIAYAGYRERE
jgi:Protein of unknown function (DUF2510)